MAFANAVLAIHDVHRPVQAVLDTPVVANAVAEQTDGRFQTGDVLTRLARRLAFTFHFTNAPTDGSSLRPLLDPNDNIDSGSGMIVWCRVSCRPRDFSFVVRRRDLLLVVFALSTSVASATLSASSNDASIDTTASEPMAEPP